MRKARGQVKINQKDSDLISLLPLEKTPLTQRLQTIPGLGLLLPIILKCY